MRAIEVGLSGVYEVSSRVSLELRDSDDIATSKAGSHTTGKRLRELITTKMSSVLGKLEILSALLEKIDLSHLNADLSSFDSLFTIFRQLYTLAELPEARKLLR